MNMDASEADCGHVFCSEPCASAMLQQPCAVCCEPVQAMAPDTLGRAARGRSAVNCPFAGYWTRYPLVTDDGAAITVEGCGSAVERRLRQEHAGKCVYRPVLCPNFCLPVCCMPALLLPGHLKHCPRRPTRCAECGIFIRFTDQTSHTVNDCAQTIIPCPADGCTVRVARAALPAHLLTCTEQKIVVQLGQAGDPLSRPAKDHAGVARKHGAMHATAASFPDTPRLESHKYW